MAHIITRRRFMQTSAAAAAVTVVGAHATYAKGPNEKLNVACVGVGGRGWDDFQGVRSENIVAICDIDDNNLTNAGKETPDAKKFNDYRKMLDSMHKEIDAIVVATPDHMHAMIASAAMVLGKHAYVEKPLAHSIQECRLLAKLAEKHKLATQMGTQIHAGGNYRRVVELIQGGAIGGVSEVHVWVGKDWSNGRHPEKGVEPPKNLHWDLWHGGAPYRPYAPNVYHPAEWRRFWDYGTGTLGDMACHYSDVAFWALNLKWPTSAEADSPDKVHPDGTASNLHVKLEFPAREKMPACVYHWYDNARRPDLINDDKVIVGGKPVKWGAGVLFVGEKGMLLCDYGQKFLLPQDDFKDFKAPEQTIPRSIGHHNEWIKACKDGSPTTCNFAYSGALSESVLLGNVAFRVGKKLEWDGEKMKAKNAPEADKYVREEYRKGYALSGLEGLA